MVIIKKIIDSYFSLVLVDITDPIKGWVIDGSNANNDMDYSKETAYFGCAWGNFSDAESGINHFIVTVIANGNPIKEFSSTAFIITDYSFHFAHNDRVIAKVEAINGASRKIASYSNGYLIDLTPAVLNYLYDSLTGLRYQTSNTELYAKWMFTDKESDISRYQIKIDEYYAGTSKKIWPIKENYATFFPSSTNAVEFFLSNLTLINGAKYTVEVIAINKALISSKHVSSGIKVDTTVPLITQVIKLWNFIQQIY